MHVGRVVPGAKQAGVHVQITKKLFLNADIKKIWMRTDTTLGSESLGIAGDAAHRSDHNWIRHRREVLIAVTYRRSMPSALYGKTLLCLFARFPRQQMDRLKPDEDQ